MDLDPEIIAQLVETFGLELEEQLQQITDDLLQLERGVAPERRSKVYESIFRAAHNLKGAAAGVGAEAVAEVAHRMESLFSLLKRENIPPLPSLVDVTLAVIDGMRRLQGGWRFGEPPEAELVDLAGELLRRLDEVTAQERQAEIAGELPAAQAQSGAATAAEGPKPVAAPASPPVEAKAAVEPEAEGEAATPRGADSDEKRSEEEKRSELVRADVRRLDAVSALSEELEMTKVELFDHIGRLRALEQRVDLLVREWRSGLPLAESILDRSADDDAISFLHGAGEGLKELRSGSAALGQRLRGTYQQLSRISGQLQGNARMLRLVRAANLLRPLVRSVRDMARELGKEVALEVSGDTVELDRAVLEGLKDPLTHLLRNAIDHGIESAQERRRVGKPPQGTVRLAVESAGGRVRLRVEDDGAGIDPEAIVRSAVEKQIVGVDEARAMSRRAKLDLVFRPGFSSKAIITNLSGRGVGLDVVRANIQALKGGVQLESELGRGTRFLLDLPLTLATDQGLVVKVADELFAIPTTAVVQVMEVDPSDLVTVEASEAVLFQGRPYPLVELASVLERSATSPERNRRLPVVLLSYGWNAIAFVVDDVVGDREIVIKRLCAPLKAVRNVSGATLTGSGEIMMVLNPADLVRSALARAGKAPAWLSAGTDEEEAVHVLVADDSITTRTLERNILEKHGYRVTVATHGKQAWDLLQTNPVDLVITDVQMPFMDGFELTDKIKRSERFRRLPVIIVTSLGNEHDKQKGIEVGADAYIIKSQFEGQTLLDLIRQLV